MAGEAASRMVYATRGPDLCRWNGVTFLCFGGGVVGHPTGVQEAPSPLSASSTFFANCIWRAKHAVRLAGRSAGVTHSNVRETPAHLKST